MYLALVMTARAFSMARRASYTKLALGSEQADCWKAMNRLIAARIRLTGPF